MKPNLEIYVKPKSGNAKGEPFKIEEMPSELWAAFLARAKQLMPDKGDNAWAAYLCDAVASLVDVDQHVLLLNEIPVQAWENVQEISHEAQCDFEHLISLAIHTASQEHLHVIRLSMELGEDGKPKREQDKEQNSHMLMMTGVPTEAWENISMNAKALVQSEVRKLTTAYNAAVKKIKEGKENPTDQQKAQLKALKEGLTHLQSHQTAEQLIAFMVVLLGMGKFNFKASVS